MTFRSLRPDVPYPPLSQPLSITEYVFSLLRKSPVASSLGETDALINATTGQRLKYADLISQVDALAAHLQSRTPLRRGDSAFVLAPSSLAVPVVYLALMKLGVVVSPANPLSTESEVAHEIDLCRPRIAFAISPLAGKIPRLELGTVLLDSKEFASILNRPGTAGGVKVDQSDSAAILYSSGTTGKMKGVLITHRNLIALVGGYYHIQPQREAGAQHPVLLVTTPMFHVFGFSMVLRSLALGDTLTFLERFTFEDMLKTVEKYRVTYIPVSPPLVVAMAKSDLVSKYDLSSLQGLACGGAPLGKDVAEKFRAKFPNVEISQLSLLLSRAYVGDPAATAATFSGDWLKTGDLCYFDDEGFLYIVDRIKELIKYKAYQVPPAELEHILLSIPAVADAAVIPYPDEEAGEIPMAFVVRKPNCNITADEIMGFVAKKVAPYKKIRKVAFIDAIPKNPSGKILRRELVNQAMTMGRSKL
uniref:4-coumarate--CoA ligase n=1 Tax=Kalanchoe fedtschenkoi TaxID=63787 RepID=A0A7N0UTJ8_KALFE